MTGTIVHIPGPGPLTSNVMSLDFLLSVLLSFSAGCYLLMGVQLLRGGSEIGGLQLGATSFVVSLWVFGGAVEMMANSFVVFSIGRTAHFVGTALVPVTLLICFRGYTGKKTPTSVVITLLIVPVLSIIVTATNFWHELMWSLPITNAAGEFLTRPVAWGSWYLFVHAPYGYAVISTGILTLVLHSSAVAPAHRRRLYLLAGATFAPIIAVAAYDVGIGPNTLSTLPLVFAAMLPIYVWLLFGEQIIEFTPLAYETVFQNMQDPVIVVDDQQRIIGLNHGAEALLGIKECDALRESLDNVFGEDATEVHAALDTGMPQKMLTSSGRFLHLQITPIATNKSETRSGRVLMFRDVSDVEKAQREVQSSEKLLRTLIDHSADGVIRMRWIATDGCKKDKELRCIFANAAAGRFLQIDPKKMIDRTAEDLLKLASTGMDPLDAEMFLQQFAAAAEAGEQLDTESKIGVDRTSKWLRVIGEPVGEDVAIRLVDITDSRAKEMQMESIALTDPLTGVLNRRGFEKDATRRLSESEDSATGALLFIDLNQFKQINDEYGHEVGDELLTIAAERLRTSLRSCDIIGRPGGDEFVALVPDVKGDVAEQLATRLTNSLEQTYLIGELRLACAASIGLALYPEHASTLTGLLRAADQAMYRAKARCRGVVNIDNTDLLEKAV